MFNRFRILAAYIFAIPPAPFPLPPRHAMRPAYAIELA